MAKLVLFVKSNISYQFYFIFFIFNVCFLFLTQTQVLIYVPVIAFYFSKRQKWMEGRMDELVDGQINGQIDAHLQNKAGKRAIF